MQYRDCSSSRFFEAAESSTRSRAFAPFDRFRSCDGATAFDQHTCRAGDGLVTALHNRAGFVDHAMDAEVQEKGGEVVERWGS